MVDDFIHGGQHECWQTPGFAVAFAAVKTLGRLIVIRDE